MNTDDERHKPQLAAVAILIKEADYAAVHEKMIQYGGKGLVVELTTEDQAALDALGDDEEFATAVNEEGEVVDDDDIEVERNKRPDDRKAVGYEALLPYGFMPSTSNVITMQRRGECSESMTNIQKICWSQS